MKSNVAALETASNKLLRFIVGARPRADETRESFCIRRNHLISLSKQESRLSVTERLCWKLVTWVEHIWRDKDSRLFHLLQVHDELFLQTVRALVGNLSGSRSIHAGATQTRASPGMLIRWAAGWLEEVGRVGGGWDNPRKHKQQTREKATFLCEFMNSSAVPQ